MKQLLTMLLAMAMLFGLGSCGGGNIPAFPTESLPQKPATNGKTLVAVFSATGNTLPLAQAIADGLGAELFEIRAKQPYTDEDLRYYTDCRADREQKDPTCRPEIEGTVVDLSAYDTVFLGYPIWHGQAPKILYTFLEQYDFSGIRIIPFCTSGSSGLGSSAENLHPSAPNALWEEGRRFAIGTGADTVRDWAKSFLTTTEKEITEVYIYCNNNRLSVTLADNPSAKAFAETLRQGDVTVTMDDYGGFEKVGALGFTLPRTDARVTTSPGDVILYRGSDITVYYGKNTWDFTLLGRIPGMTEETMLAFFGGVGKVSVRFSLQ